MSAFLTAIENIDDIFVAPALRGVFVESMQKMHDYFTKNNLLDVFDIDKFFAMYMYKTTYPNLNKLKIKFVKENKIYGGRSPKGDFHPIRNVLRVFEATPEKASIITTQEEIEKGYVPTFIHEFLHFLTLYGKVTFTENNKRVDSISYKYLNYKKSRKEIENFEFFERIEITEPLTEILAAKIAGVMPEAYPVWVSYITIINEFFGVNFEREFLKRDHRIYYNAVSKKYFDNFLNTSYTMDNYRGTKRDFETMQKISIVFDEILFRYYSLLVENISAKDFVALQAKYYHNLPYSTDNNLSLLYNDWITNGNFAYIKHLITKNNLKLNRRNYYAINDVLIKAIGLKDAQMYAEKQGADYGVRFKMNGRINVLLPKGDKLSMLSVDSAKEFSDCNVIALNPNTSFKAASFDREYKNVKFKLSESFWLSKEKGQNTFTISDYVDPKTQKKLKIDHAGTSVDITFKGGKLTLEGKKTKAEFSKESVTAYLDNLDKVIEKEIKKLKDFENEIENIKERSLVIVNSQENETQQSKRKVDKVKSNKQNQSEEEATM